MDGLIKDIFSRDLKETQSEVRLDRRAHQDHLELVMMVVQETKDLLDPLALQGHHHYQAPIDHVRKISAVLNKANSFEELK